MPSPWAAGAEVAIVGRLHGQETVNVMKFATNTNVSDPGTLDTELLALAQAVFDCVVTTLLPAITSDWKLVHVEAKRIAPVPSDPILVTSDGSHVGTRGVICSGVITSVMNLRTGGGGRSGLGRVSLPPAGNADIVAGSIDPAVLALLAVFATCIAGKFLGSAPSTNWRLGVYSRKNATALGGSFDNSFRIVTSFNPLALAGVMSSRKVGVGS